MNRDPEFIESFFRHPVPTLASIPNGEPLGTIRFVVELGAFYRKEIDSLNLEEAWRPYPDGESPWFSAAAGSWQSQFTPMWRRTLQKINTPNTDYQLKVVLNGDSLMEGMTNPLRQLLFDNLGMSGLGLGFLNPVVLAGGAVVMSGDFTKWVNGVYTSVPNGGSAAYSDNSLSVHGDTFAVYYIKESGGGTFKVQSSTDHGANWSDVAGHTAISCSNATTIGAVDTFTLTANSYQLRTVSTSGTCKIIGCSIANSTAPGVVLNSIARGGTSLDNWLLTPAAILNPILASVAPDLVFYLNTDTEVIQSSDLPDWYSQVNTAAGFVPDWIFMGLNPMGIGDWDAQNRIIRRFAIDSTQSFFDNATWRISYTLHNAAGLMSDTVHPNDDSNRMAACLFWQQSPLSWGFTAAESSGLRRRRTSRQALAGGLTGRVNYNVNSPDFGETTDAAATGSRWQYQRDLAGATLGGYAFTGSTFGGVGAGHYFFGAGGAGLAFIKATGNVIMGGFAEPFGRLEITGSVDGSKPSHVVTMTGGQTGDAIYVRDSTLAQVFGVTPAGGIQPAKNANGALVKKFLTTTITWDPGNLSNGASEKKTAITLTGAAVGDPVTAALSTIISSDWAIQACVTATDTAEVKITNNTGGAVDLGSGTLRLSCVKF